MFKTNWAVGDAAHATEHNKLGAYLNLMYYNVKSYGAVGNGSTDDTAAIADAIAAIPAQGGVLFFPPGIYLTSGGFTIAYPTIVQGCGAIGEDGSENAASKITCNSQTASLFLVTSPIAKFRDVALVNIFAGDPTAGAGITCFRDGLRQKVDYDSASVTGFYDCINVRTGSYWTMHNCRIYSPVRYGLKIANEVNPDSGDWAISNSLFIAKTRNSDAAIRMESSGGGKITGCKVNDGASTLFVTGIDLTLASGASTVILHVANSSIENVSGDAFSVTINGATFRSIVFMGNEVGLWDGSNTTGHGVNIVADNIANINGVVIGGNVFLGGSTAEAINLSKVNNVQIFGNTFQTFGSLLAQADCTNVVVQAA
jgi:hypothetical protein